MDTNQYNLEELILFDIENHLLLKDELNKDRTEDFRHIYNPVHLFCRLVDKYNYEKDIAYDYVKSRYSGLYEK